MTSCLYNIKKNIMKLNSESVRAVLPKFLRYVLVGSLVTFIDLFSLWVFVDIFGLEVLFGAVLSFSLAVIVSFVLNKTWTFKNKSSNFRKLFVKFVLVSLVGLLLTIVSMYLLSGLWYLLAKSITSLIVLFWNFLANYLWTFSGKKIQGVGFEPSLDLSIVIPAYNEEKRIAGTLKNVVSYFDNCDLVNSYEVLVIDDGSKDSTVNVVNGLGLRNVEVLSLLKNKGKGGAFRTGVFSAKGRYVLMTDADESTPIAEFAKLFAVVREDVVAIGSRYIDGSEISKSQPFYRVWMSRVANRLISVFFFDGIKDTQCGFKLFPVDMLKYVVCFQKVMRFGFDMEILLLLLNNGVKVKEVPVIWNDVEGSRVRPFRDSLRTFAELLFIKFNLVFGRYNA